MPELSIIVPVYKVEAYLPKCIDSILAQTFTDFELILIDDGSPDRCGEICDAYAAKDSRIIVVHQKNQGVSAARNGGLDLAKGTYIGFVDADDIIHPCMYETLLRCANLKNGDIICCGVDSFVVEDSLPLRVIENSELENFSVDRVRGDLFARPSMLTRFSVNKVYRRSLIQANRFEKGIKIWEDLLFLFQVYYQHDNYSTFRISEELYFYRDRMDSATHGESGYRFNGRSKLFRLHIFRHIPTKETELREKSICFFLESCLAHLNQCRQNKLKYNFFRMLRDQLTVKVAIIYWCFWGTLHRLLPPSAFKRFLVEGLF